MSENLCKHDEDCKHTYIEIGLKGYEIYMCECGVLIDIRTPKNYSNPVYPMTAKEIQKLFYDLQEYKL